MNLRPVCICLATIIMPILVGCSGPATDPTATVSGTVTLGGQPVADASVGFVPESGRPASGVTDASGKFTLTTFKRGDGALPGNHKVVITPHIPDDVANDSSPEGMAKMAEIEKRFPAKYGDARTSGLTAEVKSGEENTFSFDMTAD